MLVALCAGTNMNNMLIYINIIYRELMPHVCWNWRACLCTTHASNGQVGFPHLSNHSMGSVVFITTSPIHHWCTVYCGKAATVHAHVQTHTTPLTTGTLQYPSPDYHPPPSLPLQLLMWQPQRFHYVGVTSICLYIYIYIYKIHIHIITHTYICIYIYIYKC